MEFVNLWISIDLNRRDFESIYLKFETYKEEISLVYDKSDTSKLGIDKSGIDIFGTYEPDFIGYL